MDRTKRLIPLARDEELVVEELPDETLVYDLTHHKARCLNRTAALVWRRCDGRTTVPELTRLLEKELEAPVDEAVVWMALDRLGKARLLRERVRLPASGAGYSRREVMRTLGVVGGLALLLPVVESIVAPTAAHAASCITGTDCEARTPPFCGGTPICNEPGSCCMDIGGGECSDDPCP
ncbi:MAG: PqqD family protein [Anaerolineae bacterium]